VVVVVGASTATVVRDAGVALIPAIAVAVLLVYKASGWRVAVIRAAAVSAAACSGLAFIAVRNMLHGAPPFGPRYQSSVSFPTAMRETLKPLGAYLLAGHLYRDDSTVGAVVAGLVVVGAATAIRRQNEAMVVIAVFTAVYWLLLWYSEATTAIDPIDARLSSPAMAPSVLLAIYAVVANVGLVRRDVLRPAVLTCFAIVAVVVVAASASADVTTARSEARQGIEYNNRLLLASPLGRVTEQLAGHPGVASNNPKILYWVTGRGPVAQIPATGYYFPPSETAAELKALKTDIADGSVTYLAYFTPGNPGLDPLQLAQVGIHCSLTQAVADGTLWHCP
jgi:hypothetical protein